MPMPRRQFLSAALLATMVLAGCSASDRTQPAARNRASVSTAEAELRVRQAYVEWKGASHRLGGTGRNGIDCSAFVQAVYRDAFGVSLPRTAKAMAGVGNAVERKGLRAGDLVFFKPDGYPRHVGIYLANGEFVHVSAKKGVMISHADARYWAKHYWTARRVLNYRSDG